VGDTWPPAINCRSGGIIDLRELVTHVFPLEESVDAIQFCSDPRNGSVKTLVIDEADATQYIA
jgi:L-iditol 2-dehydrogenase